jgi:EKC/KEOPS complex subunit PCC1/LAGE3
MIDSSVEIPFASAKHASIAKQAIEVDAELSPQAVKRELSVNDNKLIAYAQPSLLKKKDLTVATFTRTFHTLTVRLARLTLNAFLENVDLVVRTINQFGAEAEKRSE